jgi:hypothetical protein
MNWVEAWWEWTLKYPSAIVSGGESTFFLSDTLSDEDELDLGGCGDDFVVFEVGNGNFLVY